jgi:hypothetical protein
VVALARHDGLKQVRMGEGKNLEADGGTAGGIDGRELAVHAQQLAAWRGHVGDRPQILLPPLVEEGGELIAVVPEGVRDVIAATSSVPAP